MRKRFTFLFCLIIAASSNILAQQDGNKVKNLSGDFQSIAGKASYTVGNAVGKTGFGIDLCPKGSREIVSMRESHSKTYVNSDGTYSKVQGNQPLHFKNEKGEWVDYDNVLKEKSKGQFELSQTDLPIYFDASTGKTTMSTDRWGKSSIVFGERATATFIDKNKSVLKEIVVNKGNGIEVSGNTVTYKNAWDGISRRQNFSIYEIETDYVINEKPSADLSGGAIVFTEFFHIPKGWSVEKGSGQLTPKGWEGDLKILDEKKLQKVFLPTPFYYDSNNGRSEGQLITGGYVYSLDNDILSLGVIVPVDWLLDSKRVYPVIIDPVVSGSLPQYSSLNYGAYDAGCQSTLNVNVPSGVITATTSTYSVQAYNGAWTNEARSRIGVGGVWTSDALGGSGAEGTINWSWNPLGLAIGPWGGGDITFVWQGWRSWGGSGCNQTYQRRTGNWVVNVTYDACPVSYEIASETTPTFTAASGCNDGSIRVGGGAWADIAVAQNTYYNWTAPGSFSANVNQYRIRPTNGTGHGGDVYLGAGASSNGWFSGTCTNVRVSTNRVSCTWVNASAILTYRHTEPTLAANNPSSITICAGVPTAITGGTATYGIRYWQGASNLGTSTAVPGSPNNVSTAGTYYYRPNNNGCWGTQQSTVVTTNPFGADGSITATTATTVCLGSPITVSASGGVGTPRYWVQSPAGGPSWNIADNAASNSPGNGYTYTPTALGTYRIHARWNTACGFCWDDPVSGCPGSVYWDFTVVGPNTVSTASSSPTTCVNTAMPSITHTTTGATGIGAATGLPGGVSASWASNTITISGTPTASGTYNYSIPLTGGCGSATATGTITVNALNTIAAGANRTTCINTAITNISLATTGATGASFSGLPTGVTGSWSAGTVTISGTPTVSGTFTYTVTTTGGCPPATATGTITVTPLNTIATGVNRTACINGAITTISLGTTGATGATFSGLPTGVTGSWSGGTATISGTPTASGTFNYTVATTGGCTPASTGGTITVSDRPLPTFTSVSPTVNVCRGTEVTYTTQSGQSNYTWTIPGTSGVDYLLVSGGTSSSNSAVIAWRAAGSGTVVSVNYQNASGCSALTPVSSSSVTLPAVSSTLSTNGQSATCRVNGTQDVSFENGGNLLLVLRSGAGADFGDVTATSYVGGAGTMQACGTTAPEFLAAYLGRRWVVQAPSAPISPAVVATLPFTASELSSLATASTTGTPANPYDNVNAANNGADLILTKYTSAVEDGNPGNNCGAGTTATATAPAIGTILGSNRYVRYSFTGFSEWYLHGEGNVSPLPIVLTSFTATCDNGQVRLDWTTATEINNDKFLIDRSSDLQTWEEVLTTSGAGNSNQPISYSGIDIRPLYGLSYYRLTQKDYDGTSETFAPISITCYNDGKGNSMMVYPNPTSDEFTVLLELMDACNDCSIEIADLNGKHIIKRNVSMTKGVNTFTFDRSLMNAGQYIIQLKSGNFIVKPVKLIVK